jgi:hypothetical protein
VVCHYFFGVSPSPTAPLFIVADRREAGSTAGKSGGKESGGKGNGGKGNGGNFLAGESGRKAVVSLARGLRESDWRCRALPTLPIESCRREINCAYYSLRSMLVVADLVKLCTTSATSNMEWRE